MARMSLNGTNRADLPARRRLSDDDDITYTVKVNGKVVARHVDAVDAARWKARGTGKATFERDA